MKTTDDSECLTISVVPLPRQILSLVQAAGGIAVIIACLKCGIVIQQHLRIPIPGSILGMILLLVLLQTKVVPDAWIREPCNWLLLLLPALFVPIYVVAVSNPAFWWRNSMILLPAAIVGAAITLSVTGWLAWRMRQP